MSVPREHPRAPAERHAPRTAAAAATRVQFFAACAYPVVTALAFPQRVAGVVFDFGLLCAWLSPLLLLLALRGLGPRAAARRGFLLGLFANAILLYFIAHTVVTHGHAPLWFGALAPFAVASYAAITTALFSTGAALLARARASHDAATERAAGRSAFAHAHASRDAAAARAGERSASGGAFAHARDLRDAPAERVAGWRASGRAFARACGLCRAFVERAFARGAAGCAFAFARALRSSTCFALALAALWVALDHLRSFALSGFPWGTLGYAQHQNAPLLGLASWTGVYGLSFVTVWIAALLLPVFDAPRAPRGQTAQAARRTSEERAGATHAARRVFARARGLCRASLKRAGASGDAGRAVVRAGFALLLCHGLGAWAAPARLSGPPLRVAVLQGNIAQGVKWAPDWAARTLGRYEELARAAAARGAEVIVFPETALPGTLDAAGETSPDTFRARVEALARETGAVLVVGAVGLDLAPAAQDYALYDSAFVFSPAGALVARYDKTHLVPFGEYLPLRAWLEAFARPLATGLARRDVTPGRAPRALTVEAPGARTAPGNPPPRARELRLGVPICYELLFPDLVRRMPKDGARLLLGMTNDAWYGATGAPYQFLAMTALRAAENGVWLARAANTGVSAFVDERGRVRERTNIFERGLLVATLRLPEAGRAPTFYARHGDIFAFACWLFVAAFGGAVGWRGSARARQHGAAERT